MLWRAGLNEFGQPERSCANAAVPSAPGPSALLQATRTWRATCSTAVPVVNQIRTYWWCSPPRIGRQRMRPVSSTARETGASFSKDKCVRTSL